MKQFAIVTSAVAASLSQMAPAASETDTLRTRCATQERQITQLEKEIDSLHELLAKNNASSQRFAAVKAPVSGPMNTTNYTVAKGDSLSKIARKHGVSLNALMAANSGINPNKLRIGQTVNLPNSATFSQNGPTPAHPASIAKAEILPAPIPATTHAEVPKALVNTQDYVVQKGDTLYGIARKNNTSVANILEQNQGLDPRKLRPGQSIAIATAQSSSVVKKAPALAKQIPEPKPVSQKETPKKEIAKADPPNQSTQQVKHTPKQIEVRTVSVKRQMTFAEFATTYGSTVDQINTMNGLKLTKGTVLAQGSELYIPNNQH
ncbi:MAG: LysM peptidoglycan-binding domain-containing protein [Rubritalea sp.]|uniref:muramidase family protein n=1 Tax=Rubritalea sp. TaxID=2109375 RepID=UPI003241EC58